MYFDNLASLLHMDGHGLFVWSAYLISLVVVLWNLVSPLVAHRRVLKTIKRQKLLTNRRPIRLQGEMS
ncbi:hypothetical protein GZ77_05805 [Endozoicomonas montiporae]|uniref:Heme exporter protein D n=2 Tax=Endozoicomonas montiporae TaxID=1027273 RepID=A0A081NC18_9GAMM|nr:heme exporter protein CcmD [Endozoicomonas montiporae]AMO56313.1 heme exporter protein CcmD [Endozoicomonas montiporae CL-33]KEQ15991.1 hypothetical protein GZ77_05805 [Endozoicomonas montiporae]